MIRFVFAILLALAPITAYSIGLTGADLGAQQTVAPSGAVSFNVVTDFGAGCSGSGNDDGAFTAAHNAIITDPRVVAGAPVTFVIPPGAVCNFTSCVGGDYFHGLNDLTVEMTGAIMQSANGGCLQWGNKNADGTNVGGAGSSGQADQPIATASAGDTCITTLTHSDAAFYPAGRMTILGALGVQGSGYPPNFTLWEYLRVASSNASTGQVCFTTSLVNSYKSTWTDLGARNCSGWACGGNPRLFNMETAWDHTLTLHGGTWKWYTEQYFSSLNVIVNDVTWIGVGNNAASCATPTYSGTVTYTNVTVTSCEIDPDKQVSSWIIDNSSLGIVRFQSAPTFASMTMQNGSSVTSINGTPGDMICNNSTIGGAPTSNTVLTIGNTAGGPLSFSGTNCHITGRVKANYAAVGPLGTGYNGANINGPYSYAAGGKIEVCCSTNGSPGFDPFSPPLFWRPGTVAIFSNPSHINAGFPFTITDNSCIDTQGAPPCTGGHLTINTTLADANLPPAEAARTITSGIYDSVTGLITLTMTNDFALDQFITLDTLTGTGAFASLNGTWATKSPTNSTTVTLKGPLGAGAATITGGNATARVVSLHVDVMRDWACSNCDGTPEVVDLSQAPAQHQPLYTYSSRTYTCTANLGNVPNSDDLNHATGYNVLGNFVSVTINVSRADTGPNGTLTVSTDQFGQIPITNQVTGVNSGWGYGTNLKIAGTRTITPTGVSGGQSGDTGTFPGANTWIGMAANGTGIFTSQDLTTETAAQCPVVTITFQASR